MAQYRSSPNFYGSLWGETLTGSGSFTPMAFVPTVFEFDINPDSLDLTNVSVASLGTPIPNSGRTGQARRYYIGDSDNLDGLWWDTHTGLGIYTYYSPYFRRGGNSKWPRHTNYGWWDADYSKGYNMYAGAYYLADIEATYYFVAAESKNGGYDIVCGRNIYNVGGYSSWNDSDVEWLKDWILRMFYGVGSEEDKPTIERVTPESDTLSAGESVVLSYKLVNIIGEVLSTEPKSITVSTGTGWGYTEETRTLKYTQGTFRSFATVVFEYNGIEYRINDTFYPKDLSSGNTNAYTPGIGTGIPSWSGGGGGNFGIDPSTGLPEVSSPIAPSLPGYGGTSGSTEGSVSNSGLFVHYAMNSAYLKVVGDWLWADELGLIIAKEVLSILYGSPIESAISLMSYPFNVTGLNGVVTNSQPLYWGGHKAGFNAPAITNPYATIDWGEVQLTEFWGSFLDYAPHTKLELYLPWCTGFVPIDPNDCLPGSLRVITNIELAKGTCLHNVIGNDNRVIATYAGSCGKQLPLTALDTSGKALSLVSTAVSLAVAGGAGAAAASAGNQAYGSFMQGAQQMGISARDAVSAGHRVRQEAMAPHLRTQQRAKNAALAGSVAATRTPSSVQRSGSFSGSSAGLGVQYPYLIISRPTQSVPSQYGNHYGYPSNIFAPLSSLKGYTEVGEVHLTGIPATDSELNELDSLLKGGVIL